jgi:flagellar operon protein
MSQPINPRLQHLIQPAAAPAAQGPKAAEAGSGPDFQAVLADRLKLSGHAQTRLQSRDIQIDADQWSRVVDGVEKAAAKGVKSSLVMVDDVALVVSVKNRTVITAVDQQHLRENVFTNINGAVIV